MKKNTSIFLQVYSELSKYYPIGIPDQSPFYDEYEGTKKLKEIIGNKFQGDIFVKWNMLLEKVSTEFPDKTLTYDNLIMSPSSTGVIELVKLNNKEYSYTALLHFSLCVFSSFYTIFGSETLTARFGGFETRFGRVVTISPINQFKESYLKLHPLIEEYYSGYVFLPYCMLMRKIKGLYLPQLGKTEEANVYQALFGPDSLDNYEIVGDKNYKKENQI